MERLHSVREIRTLMGLGTKAALRLFEFEPGVVPVESARGFLKTSNWRLFAPRVPESVFSRVRSRLQEKEEKERVDRYVELIVLQEEPPRRRASTSTRINTRAVPESARKAPLSIAELARKWKVPHEVAERAHRQLLLKASAKITA